MAAIPFLSGIDAVGVPILRVRLENLATAPATPYGAGHTYFDTGLGVQFVYDGTVWRNARARGDHTGTQVAATISNFDVQVRTSRLDQLAAPTFAVPMNGQKLTGLSTAPSAAGDSAEYSWTLSRSLSAFAAPTANVPFAGFKITGLGAPTVSGDAAEFSWVIGQIQSAAAGIASKPPVRLVATTNQTLTGLTAIDGVTPVAGDRILLVGQTTATQNGVYNAATAAWTRTTVEGPAPGEIEPGAMWLATEGTANNGTQWRVATTGTITIGTTSLNVVQFGAGNSYTNGNGISLVGSAFSIKLTANSGLVSDATGLYIDRTKVPNLFSGTIGDGTTAAIVVTHNLGTKNIVPVVRDSTTDRGVYVDWQATSTTTATFTFASAPAANAYIVSILG